MPGIKEMALRALAQSNPLTGLAEGAYRGQELMGGLDQLGTAITQSPVGDLARASLDKGSGQMSPRSELYARAIMSRLGAGAQQFEDYGQSDKGRAGVNQNIDALGEIGSAGTLSLASEVVPGMAGALIPAGAAGKMQPAVTKSLRRAALDRAIAKHSEAVPELTQTGGQFPVSIEREVALKNNVLKRLEAWKKQFGDVAPQAGDPRMSPQANAQAMDDWLKYDMATNGAQRWAEEANPEAILKARTQAMADYLERRDNLSAAEKFIAETPVKPEQYVQQTQPLPPGRSVGKLRGPPTKKAKPPRLDDDGPPTVRD